MNRDDGEKICICHGCPSYFDCGEKLAFCMWEEGKSSCIKSEIACVCPGCPVQEQMHYEHVYYCTRGNEKEQSQQ